LPGCCKASGLHRANSNCCDQKPAVTAPHKESSGAEQAPSRLALVYSLLFNRSCHCSNEHSHSSHT
jgi:hypothetical protein